KESLISFVKKSFSKPTLFSNLLSIGFRKTFGRLEDLEKLDSLLKTYDRRALPTSHLGESFFPFICFNTFPLNLVSNQLFAFTYTFYIKQITSTRCRCDLKKAAGVKSFCLQ